MKHLLPVLLLTTAALSGCGAHAATEPTAACTPPAGGRCAADVAWSGPIQVQPGGRRLQGVVQCGGTLRATETTDRVTITLHVGAVPAGAMSCARVVVGVSLADPLGSRTVVDSVSGRTIRVVPAHP